MRLIASIVVIIGFAVPHGSGPGAVHCIQPGFQDNPCHGSSRNYKFNEGFAKTAKTTVCFPEPQTKFILRVSLKRQRHKDWRLPAASARTIPRSAAWQTNSFNKQISSPSWSKSLQPIYLTQIWHPLIAGVRGQEGPRELKENLAWQSSSWLKGKEIQKEILGAAGRAEERMGERREQDFEVTRRAAVL